MKHKLVVFDWNGTILSDTLHSWKAGNTCLEFYNHPGISLKQYRETFTFPIMHFYKLNGLNVNHVLEHKDKANEIYQSAYEELASNARTRQGARSLLKWLQGHNITSIILSNYRTVHINKHLKRLKMEDLFHYVSAHNCNGTTILENTTKTGRLSEYMNKQHFKPQDTIIIGDSMEEPDIGRNLGLTSIGITDGYITEKRLKHSNPNHVIHNLNAIRPLLTQKWGLPH